MHQQSIWTKRFIEDRTSDDWRSKRDQYGRDRARIIHSASFRRLQGKTQVLGLGESDFYRTRLTHSIEVAQISSGIVEFLKNEYKELPNDLLPSSQLIEAISLAHDIGHPPFGHGGEVALNYLMRNHGGFEGNAQTLRIATKLGEHSENNGLNLTRRTLLGLIKYPAYYRDTVQISSYNSEKAPIKISSFKPPKCIFECDKEAFDFVCEPFSPENRVLFSSTKQFEGKHKKPIYKSFDTSIMEIADDIAYGIHDLEDAIALKLVTEKQWEASVVEKIKDPHGNFFLKEKISEITSRLFDDKNSKRKSAVSELVALLIEKCEITTQGKFENNLLDYKAVLNSEAINTLELFKGFVQKNVIRTPEVQTLEYKGQQMIIKIFEAIAANPDKLLHQKYYKEYQKQGEENEGALLRYICEYIAGTTDEYATRLYHKIFTPSTGSIFDRL